MSGAESQCPGVECQCSGVGGKFSMAGGKFSMAVCKTSITSGRLLMSGVTYQCPGMKLHLHSVSFKKIHIRLVFSDLSLRF